MFGKSKSSFPEQQLLAEKLLLEKAGPPMLLEKAAFQLLHNAVIDFIIKPHYPISTKALILPALFPTAQ